MTRASLSSTVWLRAAIALAGAALAMAITLVSTRLYGPGISPDSVIYLSVADSLTTGGGLVSYDGLPLADFPPLFSALLAVVVRASGASSLDAARYVNAAAFAVTVLLAAALLSPRTRSLPLFALGVALAATARPLFAVGRYALSEPLFILLSALFLLLIDRYAARPRLWLVLLMGAVAALAVLTRYTGVALIATGGLLLLLQRTGSLRANVGQAALFGLVSAAPFALLLMRNLRASGTFMGTRYPATVGPAETVGNTLATLRDWVAVPEDLRSAGSAWRKLPALLAGGMVRISEAPSAPDTPASPSGAHTPWPSLAPAALLAALYVGLLLVSSVLVLYDKIGDRLLAPVYIPLLVCLIGGLDLWVWRTKARTPLRHTLAAAGLALLLLLSSAGAMVRTVKAAEDGAGGFQRRSWYESPMLVALLEEFPAPELPIYSNSPDAVYFFLGEPARLSPRRLSPDGVPSAELLRALDGKWPPEEEALLLWFDKQERTYLFAPEELATVVSLEPLADFEDGALYTLQRKAP
jgi:4-amino-4-deoxy-L-arabinose transferase-like glycosyltransferase